MAKRIYQLAAELGVRSRHLIDKCRSEGIDVPNHMFRASNSLEATIRKWFLVQPESNAARSDRTPSHSEQGPS